MRQDTIAVHAGRADFDLLGVHAPPLDLSTTYPIRDIQLAIESVEAIARGEQPAVNPIYARLHNPTVARFESALARLEGAEAAVAFASGMAAISAVLLAARDRGAHVVGVRPIYGTTDHLLTSGLLGTEVTWASASTIGAAIRPDTGLVVIETPANPTLELIDIADAASQAGDVPLLVDSTFATPVLQQPLALGAQLVVHSATKFLGGHGDVLAGIVATSERWATKLRQVRMATGGVLHPLAAYLLHRGLPTLPVRVRQAQATAGLLASRMLRHPGVSRVAYPGLPGQDPRGLVGRQMEGPGAMVALELVGGRTEAERMLESLELITHAVSLGATDTLIQCPAALTHHVVDPAARGASGVSEGLLRLSVGLEDVEDLWADLAQAIERATGTGPTVAPFTQVGSERSPSAVARA